MTLKHLFQLICFLWLIEPLAAAIPIRLAKPGCKDTCGNVTIPYPFGIGSPDCFLNEWYEVVCHDYRPYLSKYYGQEFGGEVLNVSQDDQTVTINYSTSNISLCEDKGIWLAGNLSGSPFYYDDYSATVFGCGNVMLLANQTIVGGCTSTCDEKRKINGCYGINCCEFNVPSLLQDISLNFSSSVNRNNSCATVIFKNYRSRSTSSSDTPEILSLVVLRWWILESQLPQLQNDHQFCYSSYDNIRYRCCCKSCSEGNPYIRNGCQVISDKPYCSTSNSRKKLIVLVVGGTSFGILILGTVGFFSYNNHQKKGKKT